MRTRYRLTTAAVAFLLVILVGGVWFGVASQHTAGGSTLEVTVLGAVFSAVFVWLLLTRLRSLLAHPERRTMELGLLALNLAILIFSYAWVHHEIGLMDVSGPAPRPTNDLADAIYFSIVTSTTLGYGDFIPLGPGRPLAAIQALTGYMLLGILVSAGFNILAPHTNPGQSDTGEQSNGADGDQGGRA